MRLAVIFDNLGPYHIARLTAAARICDLLAIEVSPRSAEYGWSNETSPTNFRRVTLLDNNSDAAEAARELLPRLNDALSQHQPQAVAVPGWSSTAAFAALLWCANSRVPAISMSESTPWDEDRVGWKEWTKRRLVSLSSSALVGGSPHRDYMVQLGMAPERVFLGYDTVDNHYFAQEVDEIRSRKSEFRNKHGLPENYFLASARFIEKKNLPRLLQAYARYRTLDSKGSQSREPWSLVLLGDGPLRPALNSQLSTLKLEDHVHLPGFKQYPELPIYYGPASAFVHASSTEQWGLVVNEAMASGLPVIVSDRCGCAADLVEEDRNGFRFDPRNVEQLAELMLRIAQSPKDRLAAMGQAGRDIIGKWGPDRFARGLEAAAEKAREVGARGAGSADRLLLQLLMRARR
jgi:1,2-diacylglycerol 3-alpha-glucosyltransferase